MLEYRDTISELVTVCWVSEYLTRVSPYGPLLAMTWGGLPPVSRCRPIVPVKNHAVIEQIRLCPSVGTQYNPNPWSGRKTFCNGRR